MCTWMRICTGSFVQYENYPETLLQKPFFFFFWMDERCNYRLIRTEVMRKQIQQLKMSVILTVDLEAALLRAKPSSLMISLIFIYSYISFFYSYSYFSLLLRYLCLVFKIGCHFVHQAVNGSGFRILIVSGWVCLYSKIKRPFVWIIFWTFMRHYC